MVAIPCWMSLISPSAPRRPLTFALEHRAAADDGVVRGVDADEGRNSAHRLGVHGDPDNVRPPASLPVRAATSTARIARSSSAMSLAPSRTGA